MAQPASDAPAPQPPRRYLLGLEGCGSAAHAAAHVAALAQAVRENAVADARSELCVVLASAGEAQAVALAVEMLVSEAAQALGDRHAVSVVLLIVQALENVLDGGVVADPQRARVAGALGGIPVAALLRVIAAFDLAPRPEYRAQVQGALDILIERGRAQPAASLVAAMGGPPPEALLLLLVDKGRAALAQKLVGEDEAGRRRLVEMVYASGNVKMAARIARELRLGAHNLPHGLGDATLSSFLSWLAHRGERPLLVPDYLVGASPAVRAHGAHVLRTAGLGEIAAAVEAGEDVVLPAPDTTDGAFVELSLVPEWVDSESALQDAFEHLMGAKRVGFDAEWPPSTARIAAEDDAAAIVQLATDTRVFVLDLMSVDATAAIHKLFASPDVVKVGFSVHGDLEMLRIVDLERCLDIQRWVMADGSYERTPGLSDVCYRLLGRRLNKYQQLSNWLRRPLRPAQLEYASLDAVVLIHLWDVLGTEPPHEAFWGAGMARLAGSGGGGGSDAGHAAAGPHGHRRSENARAVAAGAASGEEPRFLVDVELSGKLCRHLRALGLDTEAAQSDMALEERVQLAASAGRVFVTRRDEARGMAADAVVVVLAEPSAREELLYLVKLFDIEILDSRIMSRCSVCNSSDLRETEPAEMVSGIVPDKVVAEDGCAVRRFFVCNGCGKVFWPGPKTAAAQEWLSELRSEIASSVQRPLEEGAA